MGKRGYEQAFPSAGLRSRSLLQFKVNQELLLKRPLPYPVKPAPLQPLPRREAESIGTRFALQMAGLSWSDLYPGLGVR